MKTFTCSGIYIWISMLLISLPAASQTLTYQKSYDSAKGEKIVSPDSNGYLVCGETPGLTGDILLLRISLTGDTLWSKVAGNSQKEVTGDCIQTKDGFVIAGSTQSFGNGSWNVLLFKVNEEGKLLWHHVYEGGMQSDRATSLKATVDSGFIITGHTRGVGNERLFLIKADASGKIEWDRIYGNQGSIEPVKVETVKDSGFLIASNYYPPGGESPDILLMNTDTSGNILRSERIGSGKSEMVWDMVASPGSGWVLCGNTNAATLSNQDGLLLNVNGSGDVIWAKTYGTDGKELLKSLEVTGDNQLISSGSILNAGDRRHRILFIETNVNGDTSTVKEFGGKEDAMAIDVISTPDSGYIICGLTRIQDKTRLYLAKTNASGFVTCRSKNRELSTMNFTPVVSPVAMDTLNHFMTVNAKLTIRDYHPKVIVHCFASGIKEHKRREQRNVSIYPNPVHNRLYIKINALRLKKNSIRLEILNSKGIRLFEASNGKVPGRVKVSFAGYPPGIYLLRLQTSRKNIMFRIIKH